MAHGHGRQSSYTAALAAAHRALSDSPAVLLLTVEQVAAVLQIGRNTVYTLIQRGELPVVRVNRTIRISAVTLERWIADRSVPSGAR